MAKGMEYGLTKAEDTGMKGQKIDLYLESYQQCIQFGRRSATVYLLENSWKNENKNRRLAEKAGRGFLRFINWKGHRPERQSPSASVPRPERRGAGRRRR